MSEQQIQAADGSLPAGAATPFVNPRDPAQALGPDGKPAVSRRAPQWADVPDEQWNDWRWQLSHRVNDVEEIGAILELTDEEREGLSAPDKFRVDITPYFISLIDPHDPDDPDPPPGHPPGPRAAGLHGDDGGLARRGPPLPRARPRASLPGSGADAGDHAVRQLLPLLHPLADGGRPDPELQPQGPRGAAGVPAPHAAGARRAHLRRRRADAGAQAASSRSSAGCARSPTSRSCASARACRSSCPSGSTTSCARCSPATTRSG